MVTKTCNKCGENKEEALFKKDYKPQYTVNGRVKYTNTCSACDVQLYKIWRVGRKDYYNTRYRIRRIERKIRAIEYKGGVCMHCGLEVHPSAFDFHHLDPTQKDQDPGLMMSCSDEKLFLELDKCILLCANCHRIEHFKDKEVLCDNSVD